MEKMGVLGEWEGEVYVPKSVDVYSVADMRRTWGTNLRFEYRITTGATAVHSVNLTKESYWSRVQEKLDMEPDEDAKTGATTEPSEWSVGKRFRDCIGCPEMVVVPAGSFKMGSPATTAGGESYQGEGLIRRVSIGQPFAVGVHEVTRGEFARFVRAMGRSMGNTCAMWDAGEGQAVESTGRNWRNPGFIQTDRHPVVCVGWTDAQAYVKWLSQETGKRYGLLSESQWEYVARSGTRTSRYWGASESGQCRHANGADTSTGFEWGVSCNDGHARTSPVGNYSANGFGLYDVLGNVWEWTQDCWNASYRGAPSDGSAWESGYCTQRVARGGSWHNPPWVLRPAFRHKAATVYRSHLLGFRVARTLTP